ncbi:HK97 family phage prohead protease [Natrinema pallidum]|uniref:HK97 family phage prohead protease n=1 Tax=Natrinema pallidum TaxID=69527 RepID=UPI003751B3F6
MTDHDTMKQQLQKDQYVEKRFRFDPGKGAVKEADDDEDGRKQVRMPVSSTAEDRDGDEFSRDGLEDMKEQIDSGRVPMFLDHGRGAEGPYYGTLGIVGRWDSAEIESEGDIDVLYATGTPATTEPAEKMTQLIEDDMPVGSSVGFRILEYERDEEEGKYRFHGVDLLEISQVGIPSNPVTVNAGDDVGIEARGALGTARQPARTQRFQRGYGGYPAMGQASHQPMPPAGQAGFGQQHGQTGQPAGVADLRQYIDDQLEGLEERLSNGTDPDTETNSDMSNDPDGGDDPADDPDGELRDAVSEQTDAVRDLTNSIDSLLEQERNTEPENTDGEGGESADGPNGGDKGSGPDEDEDGIRLFLSEDADEDVRKEFETLQERANDDGELELADSDTKLFGSEDGESSDNDGNDDGGVTI